MMEKIKHIKFHQEFYKTFERNKLGRGLCGCSKESLFESKAVKMECFN